MNKPCHRCKKIVYPVEKLNCLDKIWHKGCFNCETCHMTLTMKTYKGYNKLPYCNTHYPTTKFTAVADTPENRRLQKNTKQQSDLVYHKEFEEERGKFTAVADDPESLRLKKSQNQTSDVMYQNKGESSAPATRYDPPRQHRSSSSSSGGQPAYNPPPPQPAYQPPPSQPAEPVAPAPAPPGASGACYVAVYDYVAADTDEVSFSEGDYIDNGEVIDEGWMTGTVRSTGKHGMLPSNYVEVKQ